MRAKVLEAAREALKKITQDLLSDAFRQADSLEKEVYGIFEQAVRQATAGVSQV
jgi:exonuclease III